MPSFVKRMKDKDKCRMIRNKQRQKNYAQTNIYPPKGAWANWEEELVLEHSMTDRQLSKLLERSVQAIQLKRSRLKKEIEDERSNQQMRVIQ